MTNDNSPLRVLLLMHSLSRTGAPMVATHLFKSLGERVDLHTISLDEGPLNEELAHLGPVWNLASAPPFIPRGAALRLNARRVALALRMQKWQPDLIYVNGIIAIHIARYLPDYKAPMLLHVHEMDNSIAPHVERFPDLVRDWPARIIAVSKATRDSLVDQFGVDSGKVETIHEFVDATKFAPSQRSQNAVFTVGGAGQVSWRKGTDLWLLCAAELLGMLGPEKVRFIWLGLADQEEDHLFQLKARKMGLLPHIEFVSSTPNPAEVYAQFDVFAMTSWEDPCPLVVIENMLMETPVVCFAESGGAPEEVGATGVVVPQFSPRLMAEALAQLANEPKSRRDLGRQARQRALANFTVEVQVPKMWEQMQSLSKFEDS